MLKQILGKQLIEQDLNWLNSISLNKNIIVDLGCGDGLNIYRQALKDPNSFFIGIDANSQVLQKLSAKLAHEKVNNLVFLQHAAEGLPQELEAKVDVLQILYPWGSLLQILMFVDDRFKKVLKLLKPQAKFVAQFTYSLDFEESMIKEYELPTISESFLEEFKIKLQHLGLEQVRIERVESLAQKNITTWGKKINHKRDRDVYLLKANKEDNK